MNDKFFLFIKKTFRCNNKKMEDITKKVMDMGKSMMDNFHYTAYYIGILIVVITHIYMIRMPGMYGHSILNLIAAFLIAYYFVTKEGMMTSSASASAYAPVAPAPVAPAPVAVAAPAPVAVPVAVPAVQSA